jgi:pheromone shutdown protein TraB
MNNLKIVGTNHIMKPEVIINEIKSYSPDIICIELCKIREYIYLNNIKPQENEKDESLLGKISKAIKDKAEQEKVEYGSDMFTALQYARDNKIPYVLVDKNIQEIQQLFQKIPQNEMDGFMKEIALFEKQTIAESVVDDKVFLENLKKNYPVSFEILINAREQFIAIQLLKTILSNPDKRIICFLGKGHEKSIKNILGME